MDKRTCSAEGCDKPLLARGWCAMHYQRWRLNGDPLTVKRAGAYAPDAKCLADGCEEHPASLGYCKPHYMRWRRHGDPLTLRQASPYPANASCLVEGCGRCPKSRGYCGRHYENLRRYNEPVPQKDRPLEDRLREVGWTVTEAGCWEWNGPRIKAGYGAFTALVYGYENARAHRAMYECFVEPIPDGLIIRHRCDNPPCVNPDHLLPGTMADNSRDMVERGRNRRARCRNGHDLAEPGATRVVRKKRRDETCCVECEQDRKRRHEERENPAA